MNCLIDIIATIICESELYLIVGQLERRPPGMFEGYTPVPESTRKIFIGFPQTKLSFLEMKIV